MDFFFTLLLLDLRDAAMLKSEICSPWVLGLFALAPFVEVEWLCYPFSPIHYWVFSQWEMKLCPSRLLL